MSKNATADPITLDSIRQLVATGDSAIIGPPQPPIGEAVPAWTPRLAPIRDALAMLDAPGGLTPSGRLTIARHAARCMGGFVDLVPVEHDGEVVLWVSARDGLASVWLTLAAAAGVRFE